MCVVYLLFTRIAHLCWIRSGDAIKNALTKSRFHFLLIVFTFLYNMRGNLYREMFNVLCPIWKYTDKGALAWGGLGWAGLGWGWVEWNGVGWNPM